MTNKEKYDTACNNGAKRGDPIIANTGGGTVQGNDD